MLTVGELVNYLLDLKHLNLISDDTPICVYDNEEEDGLINRIDIDSVRRDCEMVFKDFCGVPEYTRGKNPCVLLDINK